MATAEYAPEPVQPQKSRAGWLRILFLVVAAAVVVALVYGVSQAAFSGSTTSSGTASTGTVVLDADAEGSTLFDIAGLNGGQSFESCVAVRYDGSITPAPVLLFGTSGGDLDRYLDMVVQVGSGKSFTPGNTGCTGFTSTGQVYSGTLAGFVSAHGSFATGQPTTWTATTKGEVKGFRFLLTVQDTNDAQGKSAGPTFTWETRPGS